MSLIYLDYAATTPVDPRVLDAMLPYFNERFGNAASTGHAAGKAARDAVEHAREQVAAVLGADPREIVWTSGATESDNLALQGVTFAPYYAGRGNHIVTAATEHKAVIDCCAHLASQGVHVTRLPVDGDGLIGLDRLADAITPETRLVSVMHANNETGVLQPIREIGAICRARGVLFHTDATQSFGKLPIDVNRDHIDLLSLSAHKIYGPKGVGALYVRRKGPRVRCAPLIHGGGHEGGLRSGTLNVPGIVGLGLAAEIAGRDPETEQARIAELRDLLESALMRRLAGVSRNGAPGARLAGFANLTFAGAAAEAIMAGAPEVAVSAGAACSSAARLSSYVLAAMGRDREAIECSIRFSLGRPTTAGEIHEAAARIAEAVERAREPGYRARCGG